MFTFTSARLVDHFTKRANAIRGGIVAATVMVPDELRWWYYQEFGTFGGYPIRAKDGGMLKLPEKGGFSLFHKEIIHPGVKAKHYIAKIIPEIDALAFAEMRLALLEADYNLSAVRAILVQRIMPKVVDLIATSMGESLGPSREGGKLEGQDPESVYRANVEIVDSST